MSFRASNVLPETGYRNAKNYALQVQEYCQSRSTQMLADTNSDVVLTTFHEMCGCSLIGRIAKIGDK